MEESSEKCNRIVIAHGKMRSRIISQGDCNAPGTIIEGMLHIVKDLVYQCVIIYINNIIIYSGSYEEHGRD